MKRDHNCNNLRTTGRDPQPSHCPLHRKLRSPYLSSAVSLTLPVIPEARLTAPTAEGPKVCAVEIVAHGEILAVIPECGYSIAVVISMPQHYIPYGASEGYVLQRTSHARELRELVHKSSIKGLLFRSVIVGLIAGVILAGIERRRLGSASVWVRCRQPEIEAINRRSIRTRDKTRFPSVGLRPWDTCRSSDRKTRFPGR